jgi:hypothetical protein
LVKQIILNILYNIPSVHTDVKRDSDKAEIFRKIDRHLTLLSIHQLQRQGAYLRTGRRIGRIKSVAKTV